jgi:hypothetical protein
VKWVTTLNIQCMVLVLQGFSCKHAVVKIVNNVASKLHTTIFQMCSELDITNHHNDREVR